MVAEVADIRAPQVGTDAVAKLIELSRRLYLSTISTEEPPLTDDEDKEFRAALAQADAETWDYSVFGAPAAPDAIELAPDPLVSS